MIAEQWWLAEVDKYGTARPIDGPHYDMAGVAKARYLFDGLGLTKGRKLVCIEARVTEIAADGSDVNMQALGACHEIGLRPDPKD